MGQKSESIRGPEPLTDRKQVIKYGAIAAAVVVSLTWGTLDFLDRRESSRLRDLVEQSLMKYAGNRDGTVTRAERDEFQADFASKSGLTYVSGFPYRYGNGEIVTAKELTRLWTKYIATEFKNGSLDDNL